MIKNKGIPYNAVSFRYNILKIMNCEIRNIFYPMNSLINITEAPRVDILNSKFENINICGAIIKNRFANINQANFSQIDTSYISYYQQSLI